MGDFLKRAMSVGNCGCHLQLDDRYVRSVLDNSGMRQAKTRVPPGSNNSRPRKGRCYLEAAQLQFHGRCESAHAHSKTEPPVRHWEVYTTSREFKDTLKDDRNASSVS